MDKIKEYWAHKKRKHLVNLCKICHTVIINRKKNAIYCKKCSRNINDIKSKVYTYIKFYLNKIRKQYPDYIIRVINSKVIIENKDKSEKL